MIGYFFRGGIENGDGSCLFRSFNNFRGPSKSKSISTNSFLDSDCSDSDSSGLDSDLLGRSNSENALGSSSENAVSRVSGPFRRANSFDSRTNSSSANSLGRGANLLGRSANSLGGFTLVEHPFELSNISRVPLKSINEDVPVTFIDPPPFNIQRFRNKIDLDDGELDSDSFSSPGPNPRMLYYFCIFFIFFIFFYCFFYLFYYKIEVAK